MLALQLLLVVMVAQAFLRLLLGLLYFMQAAEAGEIQVFLLIVEQAAAVLAEMAALLQLLEQQILDLAEAALVHPQTRDPAQREQLVLLFYLFQHFLTAEYIQVHPQLRHLVRIQSLSLLDQGATHYEHLCKSFGWSGH